MREEGFDPSECAEKGHEAADKVTKKPSSRERQEKEVFEDESSGGVKEGRLHFWANEVRTPLTRTSMKL